MKYFVTLLLFASLATTGIAFAETHEEPGGTEAPSTEGAEVEAPDAGQQPPSAGETDDMGEVEGGEKPKY